eukprot:jgi/Botrbrau1/10990/Bobra.0234s0015.2
MDICNGQTIVLAKAGQEIWPDKGSIMGGKPPSKAQPDPPSKKLNERPPSLLAFNSPDLEAKYQQHLSQTAMCFAWSFCMANIVGWLSFFYKIWSKSPAARALLPPISMSLAFNFLPALALAGLLGLWTDAYTKRYRTINLMMSVLQLGVHNYTRQLFLWSNSVGLKAGAGQVSFGAFATENLYLTIMWFRVVTLPVDQVTDLIVVTVSLLNNMAGNDLICNSPIWGYSPVTLSRPMLAVVKSASCWLFTSLAPDGGTAMHTCTAPPEVSVLCPAALAFWEIVGWWLACVVVMVREIASRRAFLKLKAPSKNRKSLQQAKAWPGLLVSKCITFLVALYALAGFAWAVCLLVYK